MEIVPLVQNIKVVRCLEGIASKTSDKSNVRYPVTKYDDNNILEFERKKFCTREIKEQPYYAMNVVFFNISNSKNSRQVDEIDGEQELDLSNMGLRIISCLRSLDTHYLCKLDLSHNRLIDQSLDFDIPPLLQDLDLSYNRITSLPCSIRNSQLIKLSLSENQFRVIPKELPNSLMILHLSKNSVDEITDDLPKSLTILNLSDNCIKEIPVTLLFSLKKLDMLDLSNNLLKNIPVIPEKHKLSFLDISGCCVIDKSHLESLITRHHRLRLYV